jgi:hypothetical protein
MEIWYKTTQSVIQEVLMRTNVGIRSHYNKKSFVETLCYRHFLNLPLYKL